MAGDWIKWTKGLERKREVLMMAASLDRAPEEIAGRLMRLWDWCDDNIGDGQVAESGCASVTLGAQQLSLIDGITGVVGFADAMSATGWLVQENWTLTFPNYARHNGKTAKSRSLSQWRMQRKRYADDVTSAQPEKRREEYINTPLPPKFIAPTLEQVAAYCIERNNGIDPDEFLSHYEANGWVQGRHCKPVKSWKACVRTWEADRRKKQPPAPAARIATADDLATWNPATGASA
jgi:hypothetical protein